MTARRIAASLCPILIRLADRGPVETCWEPAFTVGRLDQD
jgi:hypothetical protein